MSLNRLSPLALSVVALAALGGCANPYAPDQMFETTVRAECAFAFRCCTAAERGTGFRSEEACVEESLENGSPLAQLGLRAKAAIDAGKGVFDAELAERCTKPGIDARYACDAEAVLDPEPVDLECAVGRGRLFVDGTIEDGDDCTDNLECADEGSCVREEPDAAGSVIITVAGTCVAPGAAGDSCLVGGCQSGLFCEPAAGTCQEIQLLADGEPCQSASQCESNACSAGVCGGADDVTVDICNGQ